MGEAIKYYSSDRITQIVGEWSCCLIDEKLNIEIIFNNGDMVFYNNENDLSEKILRISRDEKLRRSIARKGNKNI